MIFDGVSIKTNIIIHGKLKFDIEILNNNDLDKNQYKLIIDECKHLKILIMNYTQTI